jgi:glycosyltransferase 2 family protein
MSGSADSEKRKTIARVISVVKIVILAALIYWLWTRFPKDQWDVLVRQKKDWWRLLLAFVIVLSAVILSFWRWRLLVHAVGVPMKFFEAIRLGFLGYLLNQVSIGSIGGDLFKAIEAARQSEGKRTEVVASVLVDRAIGLLGLLLVAGAALATAPNLSPVMQGIRWGALAVGTIGITGLVGIVIAGSKLPTSLLKRIPFIGTQATRFVNACMVFQGRPRLLAEMVGSSMLVHVFLTLGCVLISHSLYETTPTVRQHFMSIPPAVAAATVPITPGGIGVQEAAIEALFKEIPDIPAEFSPFIMAIFFRGLLFSSTIIGAIYYFFGIGSKTTR